MAGVLPLVATFTALKELQTKAIQHRKLPYSTFMSVHTASLHKAAVTFGFLFFDYFFLPEAKSTIMQPKHARPSQVNKSNAFRVLFQVRVPIFTSS